MQMVSGRWNNAWLLVTFPVHCPPLRVLCGKRGWHLVISPDPNIECNAFACQLGESEANAIADSLTATGFLCHNEFRNLFKTPMMENWIHSAKGRQSRPQNAESAFVYT